jgi:hypothetical protein
MEGAQAIEEDMAANDEVESQSAPALVADSEQRKPTADGERPKQCALNDPHVKRALPLIVKLLYSQ